MPSYTFNSKAFHVDKALHDHSVFSYEMDEASLAIRMGGCYELGELDMIREALAEANRLFKHRNWVEIVEAQDEYGHGLWSVVVWRDGVSYPNDWLGIKSLAYDQLGRLCQEGHAADRGWLKKELQ